MDKDEVVSEEQGTCSICGKDTFSRPNWDGSTTCSIRCTGKWLDIYMKEERIEWDKMKDDVRSMLLKLKSLEQGEGSH